MNTEPVPPVALIIAAHPSQVSFDSTSGYLRVDAGGRDWYDLLQRQLPDLVVADTTTPGLDALLLCSALRVDRALAQTLLVLLGPPSTPAFEITRLLDAGADDWMSTPVDSGLLAAKLTRLRDRRQGERQMQARLAELEGQVAKLEAALRAMSTNAHHVDAIGRLAGGVAHNFNNLLTVVLGSSELLLAQLPEGSQPWQQARDAHDAALRAAALTNQLLAFSRKQMLRPTQVQLNLTLTDLLPSLHGILGTSVDLQLTLEEGLPDVFVDPAQIRRVVMELAGHAREAMPAGGTFLLETRRVVLTEAYVAAHVNVQAGVYVMLALSDTGSGMDVDTQLRLFEPFFSAKTSTHGDNLGLSIVYGIVRQSGGNIWVYSEPGRGTTFKIYLPEARAGRMRASGTTASHPLPRGKASVLLVEDEPGVRIVASRVLESCGYHVVTAENGEDALARCLQKGFEPDLLITDVVMPGISGNQLVARLRAGRRDLRVLFTSGFSDEAVLQQGVGQGEHFLSKPFTPFDLAHKVRQVLGWGQTPRDRGLFAPGDPI